MATIASIRAPRLAPLGPMLWQQTKTEFVRKVRNPLFAMVTILLPVLLFTMIGLSQSGHTAGVVAKQYMLVAIATYGIMNVMLFSFGGGIAAERSQRLHVLTRATPLRPSILLLARVLMAAMYGLLTLVVLFGFGAIVGVHFDLATTATLVVRLLIGSLPLIALGFAIGYVMNPAAAPVVLNLVGLTLAFASGYFAPITEMPHVIQQIAPYLPTFRLGELAWNAIGAQTGDTILSSVLWLVGYGVVFAALAIWGYGREEQRTFE